MFLRTVISPISRDSVSITCTISYIGVIIEKSVSIYNMTSISHALIGASIAARINNPLVAGIVSLVTHFACDAIPHWDLGTNWRQRPKIVTGTLAIIETLVAIFGTYFLVAPTFQSVYVLIVCLVMSLIPDWLEVPYYLLLSKSPKSFYWIYKFQSLIHSRLQAPLGVMTQIVIVGLFLWVGFGM